MKKKLIVFNLVISLMCLAACQKEQASIGTNQMDLQMEISGNKKALISVIPASWYNSFKRIWFVLADAEGNVLNMTEYQPGQTMVKLNATLPDKHSSINFFKIMEYRDGGAYHIDGYIDVKRGSVFDEKFPGSKNIELPGFLLNMVNVPAFTKMQVSSDARYAELVNQTEIAGLNRDGFNAYQGGKLFVQIQKENQAHYNFFDIHLNGGNTLLVDAAKCLIQSTRKEVVFPAEAVMTSSSTFAIPDLNFRESYFLGRTRGSNNPLVQFIPEGVFSNYQTYMHYTIPLVAGKKDTWTYSQIKVGAFPSKIEKLNIGLNLLSDRAENFKAEVTGRYDYYRASFSNYRYATANSFPHSELRIFSTSKNPSFRLPQLLQTIQWPQFQMENVVFIDYDRPGKAIFDYAVNHQLKVSVQKEAFYYFPIQPSLQLNQKNNAMKSNAAADPLLREALSTKSILAAKMGLQ